MNFPIGPDTPEDALAQAIATGLVIEGFDPGNALPFAISIMAACEKGHDDPLKGVEYLLKGRRWSDEWWVKYHPETERAKKAQQRLLEQEEGTDVPGTPTNEELLKLADKYPPPPEWYEEDVDVFASETPQQFKPGDRVIRNPEDFECGDFASWDCGEGVGVVLPEDPDCPTADLGMVEVRWPTGRATHRLGELLPAPPEEIGKKDP